MSHRRAALLLAGALPVSACISLDLAGRPWPCGSESDCASGFTCAWSQEATEERCLPDDDPTLVGPCADLVPAACQGGTGCELSCVPATEGLVGCNPTLDGVCGERPEEAPAHMVSVEAYSIGTQEVSRAEFAAFLDETEELPGELFDSAAEGAPLSLVEGGWQPVGEGALPMTHVAWKGASAWCAWRGLTLCSEARWEIAARGGCELHDEPCTETTPALPWGEDPLGCARTWWSGCGEGPAPVGARSEGASPYGPRDLVGNVAEWVRDCGHEDYEGAPEDGASWLGDCTTRVVRGGSYASEASELRASARRFEPPEVTAADIGFRCCAATSP